MYFAPLFMFLVPSVCGSEEMSSQLSKVLCQISRGMARHCSPAAPAALTIPTMSTMHRKFRWLRKLRKLRPGSGQFLGIGATSATWFAHCH